MALTYSVRALLRIWEVLGRRLAEDFAPSGRYLVDEYINGLEVRETLEQLATSLPLQPAHSLRSHLHTLDSAFIAATEDDGGRSIAWAVNPKHERPDGAWWWNRRPRRIPWEV